MSSKLSKLFWKVIGHPVPHLTVASGCFGYTVYHQLNSNPIQEADAYSCVDMQGTPDLGGPFMLIDCDGRPRSQLEFQGTWQFFYFGFTECPDVCPSQLRRMTLVVDDIKKKFPDEKFSVLFITCDPTRDSCECVREYLKDYHPDFLGLTGTPEQIRDICYNYHVHISIPTDEDLKRGDYLIDHSIATFLFTPEGQYINHWGTEHTSEDMIHYIERYINQHNENLRIHGSKR